MNPLDFLGKKLQEGLSTVENWGSAAGNDVTNAVKNVFSTGAQPQQPAPTVQAPKAVNTPLPNQLQVQQPNIQQPVQPPQPKPIQLEDTQPKPVPLPNLVKPQPAQANTVKVTQPQIAQPKVAPINIVPQKNGFSPTPMNNKGQPVAPTPKDDNPYADNPLKDLITRPIAEIGATLRGQTINPSTDFQKRVFGDVPVKPIQQDVQGVYQVNAKENGPIIGATVGAGDLAMHVLNDIPFVALGGKIAGTLIKSIQTGEDLSRAAEAVDEAAQASKGAESQNILQGAKGQTETVPQEQTYPQESPQGQQISTDDNGQRTLAQTKKTTPTQENQQSIQEGLQGETLANDNTSSVDVKNGFPARDLEAEREAYQAFADSGNIVKASRVYADMTGEDMVAAHAATTRMLQDAGKLPFSDEDITKIMAPVNISDKVPSKTADALQRLADTYKYQIKNPKDAGELIDKAQGLSQEFKLRAKDLQRAMSQELTPGERQAVRDSLEGVATKEEVTPEVKAVTDAVKQFNEKGLNVLQVAKPDVREVENYATRLYRGNKLPGSENVPIRVRLGQLSDLFDTRSRFGEGRQIQKFVSKDGEVRYGTKQSTGLHTYQGELRDSSGKVFRPTATSTRELSEQGDLKFERDYGRIAQEYHSHIGQVMARYQAFQELLGNPEKYGIVDEPAAGLLEIKGVPELAGKYAPTKLATQIMDSFKAPETRSLAEQAYRSASHVITQFIVYNPLFHGRNLNELAGLAAGKVSQFGPLALKESYARLALSGPEYRDELLTRLLRAGGGLETYGSETQTMLSDALDKLGLPHFNKANAVAMSKIDTGIRLSLFDLLTHNGMEDEEAARTIDQFLGDRKNVGKIMNNVGMFWNYQRTQLRALSQLRDPGVAMSFIEQAAVHFGVQKAFQEWTGNKHASIGNPGVFGLINTGNNIRQGNLRQEAATKLNPLITAGANQILGEDLYSGQKLNTPGDRVKNAVDTLFAPSQLASKVSDGKASIPQEVLQAATGLSLPHTKGTPAVPNTSNPLASVINQPGSKAAQGNDATGIDQANNYYTLKDKMTKSLQGDQVATDAANQYLDKDKTPDGKTVLNNQYVQASNDQKLASNPKALGAVQTFEKGLPNHNPMWDLPTDKLRVYLTYKGMVPGDPNQVVLEQKNPWLVGQFAKEVAWGSKLQLGGNVIQDPQYVPYPTLTQSQQSLLAQVSALSAKQNRTADENKQLQTLEGNTDLQTAYALLNNYTNSRRSLWPGVQPIPFPSQNLSPEQEQMLQYESSLPKGSGARKSFITSNQDAWNQIQQILAENTIYNVEKYGGIIQQGGTEDNFLKDVYNAGKYDIAPVQQSDGSTSYQVNPSLAYSQGSGSGSSSQRKPLVPRPQKPKKHTAKILRVKQHKIRSVHISKSPRIKIKKAQTLKPVRIGHPGPLKIR